MKNKLRIGQKLRYPVAIAVGGFLTLTSFQNCGKAGFESTGQENLEFMQQEIQSDMTPFAFDAALDQITYLSCANPGAGTKSFAFKFGAYEVRAPLAPGTPDVVQSGVKIAKSYIDWARATLKPNFDPNNPNNVTASVTDAKIYLSNSKRNEKAQLQFSMRKINDLNAVYSTQATAVYGIDVVPLLGILTDDRWAAPLFNESDFSSANTNPRYVNFFTLADAEERAMEGALNLNQNEEMAEAFRERFYSEALLTLGYDDNINQMTLRSPAPDNKRIAYGLGYKLTFSQYYDGAVAANFRSPQNVLEVIKEIQLDTGKAAAPERTWSCPASRRYLIVRKQDADQNPALCPKTRFADINTNPAIKKEYEILRRHFPAKDFDVSVTGRCVIPLTFSCYRDETLNGAAVGVEYDVTKSCFYNSENNKSQYPPGGIPVKYCTEYASICLRN